MQIHRGKPKLVIIAGPNASGKSELAVRIAKKFNGEIISADSRQVYRGLDIGTGKVEGEWRNKVKTPAGGEARHGRQKSKPKTPTQNPKFFVYKNVTHHCIDFVPPERQFTVAEFQERAKKTIQDICSRGKIPIIAGGTGFWIDSVAYGINYPSVSPDKKLRRKLAKKNAAELLKILRKLDSKRAETVEQKNPRRLIRAIEIAKKLGRVPEISVKSPYQILWLGVKRTPEELEKRIRKRLLQRIRNGIIKEAKNLRNRGLSWKRFYELGLEYRYLADFLRGKTNKKEFMANLERAIIDYARRQMTWFKRNKKIKWARDGARAKILVKKFL